MIKSKLRLPGAFVSNIKYFTYKLGMYLNNTSLAVGKDNSQLAKNSVNNFTLNNCLFCTTNIVNNNDRSRYVYSDYGKIFDGLGSPTFGNYFA